MQFFIVVKTEPETILCSADVFYLGFFVFFGFGSFGFDFPEDHVVLKVIIISKNESKPGVCLKLEIKVK